MLKQIPNLLFYLLFSLLLAGGLSLVIAYSFNYEVMNVIFWAGLMLAVLGAMSSITGNPTGSSFFGGINSQTQTVANVETVQMEREITQYYKTFKKHAVFNPRVSSISIIFAGVVLLLVSYLFS